MRKLFTVLSLILLLVTIVFGQAAVDIPLTASDGIGLIDALAIGVDTSATNGIDPGLGEGDLPPFPPGGSFEARFDLTPYAGEPLSSYKDYRNAPSLPFTGTVEYKLVWQLSSGASTFQISYSLPPEVTINIQDLFGGILFNSGTLSDSGIFSVPLPFITSYGAYITMTVGEPCPVTEASNPNPVDLQTNVQITGTSLEWVNDSGTENIEVWFGPNARALKVYDGSVINSWPLGTLDYGTEYTWYVVSRNAECGIQSPDWTFTTVPDTNLVIDSIIVYPQNLTNWTGSCNVTSKTQVSLVHGYNTEVGWMVFDITAIPNNVTINSVIFNGYLYENSWPYWSITPMGNVYPVTDGASTVFNQVSTHSAEGIAYSFNEETGTLSNDWLTRTLGSAATLDMQNSLSKNWFALGILDFDFSTNYYVKFHGWAEANKPYLKIIYSFHAETAFQFTSDVEHGWNMVSIPGKLPGEQLVDNWFPFRDNSANVFKFTNGYQAVTTLTPGPGYWMKHSGTRTYNTGDEWPSGGLLNVVHEPITASSGWNLFGPYEESVSVASLNTIPSGLINGLVYGYTAGYFIASQLNPGRSYWVKLTADGQILIPDASLKISNEATNWIHDDWGRISFSDAAGNNFTLYAVNGNIDLSLYELPPAPPQGMFDIRFGSGKIAEDINSSVKTIDLSGVTYPLTVRAEGINIKLMDETGRTLNADLKDGEEVVLNSSAINKLMVTGELVPAVYSLEQNYPNPFNPATTIEFSLPEDVNSVKLTIYNALGERVAELVNGSLMAGKYNYQWNAKDAATGMYIYELRTEKFTAIKKMILLK